MTKGEFLIRVLDKFLSGRFIVLVMVAITYCSVINICLYLATEGKIDIEFLKGLIAGLAGNVVMFWKDYSVRTDRKEVAPDVQKSV